jgi:hypothetical protein
MIPDAQASVILIPLDIPDVCVLQTELTKAGELILTVQTSLTSTTCRRCGRTITDRRLRPHGIVLPCSITLSTAVMTMAHFRVALSTSAHPGSHRA